jgi:transposase-like protein
MSLSRRTFTKEFKESAVRRLELRASVARVARACKLNPNVLYRWRRELRKYAATAFPGDGHGRIEQTGLPNWSARSAANPRKTPLAPSAPGQPIRDGKPTFQAQYTRPATDDKKPLVGWGFLARSQRPLPSVNARSLIA